VPLSGPPFQLEGTLYTAGGTYTLNLGLLQREFQVQSGGTVTFDGPVENPLLDIQAQYNVRLPPPDKDLGVIVKLSGRLIPYPGIDFTSNADYYIGPSDLVSYLLTGKPGFDYGANAQASQALASFIAPTISAYAADKFRSSRLGSLIDFNLQLGQLSSGMGSTKNENLSNLFYSATVGAGKQIGNLSLGVSSSLCGLNQSAGNSFAARDLLGAQAEYRFNSKNSSKIAYDPGTQARGCSVAQDYITFIRTPSQFSFSFSQTWRF
jgi:hypothetical protein